MGSAHDLLSILIFIFCRKQMLFSQKNVKKVNTMKQKLSFKARVAIKVVKMHLERCCITLRTWPSPVQKRQQPRLHCSNGSDRHSLPLRETHERHEPSLHNGWTRTKTREKKPASRHCTQQHTGTAGCARAKGGTRKRNAQKEEGG